MYWIILILFSSGQTGAAVVTQPMSQEVCQKIADETVKSSGGEVAAIKCVQRLQDN